MTTILRISFVSMVAALSFLAYAEMASAASTWNVDAAGSGTCVAVTDQNCTTIDAAVTASSDGDTINIAAGTYNEGATIVTVAHSLTFSGPNALISPNGGTRVAEAIIEADNSNGTFNITSSSATVAFKGLAFQTAGAEMRSDYAGATILLEKNIFTGARADGMYFDDPNLTVTDNLFTAYHTSASETIQMGVSSLPRVGAISITNNTWTDITGNGALNSSNQSGTVSNNTFDGVEYYGILVASNANLTISNNVFNNITNPTVGPTGNELTWGAGVRFYEAASTTIASVTGNTFSNSYLGVSVRATNSDITGANISVDHNSFTGNTAGILNAAVGTLQATHNWWNAASGPTAASNPGGTGDSVSTNVNFTPWFSNAGMTTIAGSPVINGVNGYNTIQAAVDAATAGDTITVAAGTYSEHVNISKALTINGANIGVTGTSTRAAESIVDGSGTDAAFAVHANNVTIDGFKIQNGGGVSPFGTTLNSGIWMADPTNATIKNNIITGNMFGIWADCGGTCVIERNLFDGNNIAGGPGAGSISADSTIGLSITNNEFKNETEGNAVLLQGAASSHTTVSITGNYFHDNAYTNVALYGVSGATITDNRVIPAADSTGFGFDGADTNITFTNNTITGGERGVRIGDPYTIGNNGLITMHNNNFLTQTHFGVGTDGGYTGIVNAENNWWGAVSGPKATTTPITNPSGTGSPAVGDVDFIPWLTNFTSPSGVATTTGSTATTTTASSTTNKVTVEYSPNTVITGSSTWDGVVYGPTFVPTTVVPTPDSGFTASAIYSIEIGTSTGELDLSPPVKITFFGQGGQYVGWSRNGVFHAISVTCDGSTPPGNISAAGGNCKMTVGNDLVVWTDHFTVFTVYSQTAIPSSSGGGGGGGNGPIVGSFGGGGGSGGGTAVALPNNGGGQPGTTGGTLTPTGTGGGNVLGASTYNFSVNLGYGARGADVIALQQILIDAGFLHIAAPTGWFGPLTRAAVKQWQAAHGIINTGFVGPLTRAALNAMNTNSAAIRAAAIAQLQIQIASLTAQLNAYIAAHPTGH